LPPNHSDTLCKDRQIIDVKQDSALGGPFVKARATRRLTSRPNTERIGDESLIPLFSRFVRHNIWALTSFSAPDGESQFVVRRRISRGALTFDPSTAAESGFDGPRRRSVCRTLPQPCRQGSIRWHFR
jgi:hypothetical protein